MRSHAHVDLRELSMCPAACTHKRKCIAQANGEIDLCGRDKRIDTPLQISHFRKALRLPHFSMVAHFHLLHAQFRQLDWQISQPKIWPSYNNLKNKTIPRSEVPFAAIILPENGEHICTNSRVTALNSHNDYVIYEMKICDLENRKWSLGNGSSFSFHLYFVFLHFITVSVVDKIEPQTNKCTS